MHLAEVNVARLRYPLADPRAADFVDNLDRVNALAEASDGFVWQLKDETGNATQISAYDDPAIIINISVWRSVEALEAFAYRGHPSPFRPAAEGMVRALRRPPIWRSGGWRRGPLPTPPKDAGGSPISTVSARRLSPSRSSAAFRQALALPVAPGR